MLSPVETSISSSRLEGVEDRACAISNNSFVESPIAETTTTTCCVLFLSIMMSLALLIFSKSFSDEPPNFMTSLSILKDLISH